MSLVHVGPAHKAACQRKANGASCEEQRGRNSLHRRDELRHDDGLVFAVDVLLGVKREAKTAASQIFDLAKAGDENIAYIERFGKPNPLRCQHCNTPPKGQSSAQDQCLATGIVQFRTVRPCDAYRTMKLARSMPSFGEAA